MKPLKILLPVLCLLPLSACQTMDTLISDVKSINMPKLGAQQDSASALLVADNCPETEVVKELSTIHNFSDTYNKTAENLISNAAITNIQGLCSFKNQIMTVDTKLSFSGTLGAAGQAANNAGQSISHPFFVAVTDPAGKIIAKEMFSAPMPYSATQTTQTYNETMRQVIPLINHKDGSDYKVLVGFQLSQDQLAHNVKMIAKKNAEEEAKAQTQTSPTSKTDGVSTTPQSTSSGGFFGKAKSFFTTPLKVESKTNAQAVATTPAQGDTAAKEAVTAIKETATGAASEISDNGVQIIKRPDLLPTDITTRPVNQ